MAQKQDPVPDPQHWFDVIPRLPTCKNGGQGQTHIEVMLDDEVLLAEEEGADGDEGHVGPRHPGLGVEGREPLLGEDAQANGGLLNWPLPARIKRR
jgi:hypothetical protein